MLDSDAAIEVEVSDSFSTSSQSLLSVLAAITALQTTVILIVVVVVIFLLYKYSTRHRIKSVTVKPAEHVMEAVTELTAEEEMYETVEPNISAKNHKKINPYTQ